MAIDLHIHTAASNDGELSPLEIIRLAKANSLQAIAITDHDTVDGVEAALCWGAKHGVEVIPGCEFSTGHQGTWLHVLGYFIDIQHPGIKNWCQMINAGRRNNVDSQIANLRAAGLYLDKAKVLADGLQPMPVSYSLAIFSDRRNDQHPLINQYRTQENGAIKFCLDWIATGRPYNAPLPIPQIQEVICLIRESGGVPVLAHPAATLGTDHDELLKALIKCGLAGIEAFTTWHTPEQEDHYDQFCRQNGVIATCGSDFHGKSKPRIRIGQVRNNPYAVVKQLKDLIPRPDH